MLCRNLNLHPYIEIKGNWDSTKFAIAYNIVKKYAMETKVTWLSTSINYLKFVAKTDSYARLCYIVETITESVISDCIGLYTAHNSVFIGAMYTNLTTATIQLAIDAGIPVEAYTVNDADTMLALDSYISGVTSDIYDYPSVLQGE